MAELVKGIANLFQSLFQIVYGAVATVVSAVVGTFEAAVNFVVSLIKGVFNVSEDLLKLIVGTYILLVQNQNGHCANDQTTGNLTLIITLFIAYWGYVLFQQRQGNQNPQPIKELAGKVQNAAKQN